MAEFNNNPTEFVDFNDLFPVLNEKVGLTYEQWRKAIENINFVKDNLGVSNVERGNVNTSIVDNDSLVGVDITTREYIVEKNGIQRTVIYLDFDLRLPAGKVKSVNGRTGDVKITNLSNEDNGIHQIGVGNQAAMYSVEDAPSNQKYSTIIVRNGRIEIETGIQGVKSNSSVVMENGIIDSRGQTFTFNGVNVATLDDINNAIGNVSALLGDTEDLEV